MSETSLPNTWPHNTLHERWIQAVEQTCRAVMGQSGLPAKAWDLGGAYACMIMNVQRKASMLPWELDLAGNPIPSKRAKALQTCWEAFHGSEFEGPIQPFGRLCWYLSHRPTHPMMPRTTPGFFLGWRLEHGIRYQGVLMIGDYKSSPA